MDSRGFSCRLLPSTNLLVANHKCINNKKTQATPPQVITLCRRRLALYDQNQPREENEDDE